MAIATPTEGPVTSEHAARVGRAASATQAVIAVSAGGAVRARWIAWNH